MSLDQETADIIDALQTALDAIKGEGWTDETLKALKDALDALNDLSLAEIEASIVLAKQTTLEQRPTLAEIEASAVLAKEASVHELPTLAEIESSPVLAKDATVAKEATLVLVDGKVDAINAKTQNLPASPAAQEDIAAAHLVTDGKIDAAQADISSVKSKTDNLPVSPASSQDVSGAHLVTDGKIDAVQLAVDAIKAKTDNLPAAPASQDDVAGAHALTDGKVNAVQAEVLAVKAKTDLIPAELAGLLYAVGGGPYALSDDVLFADDEVASKDSADYVKAKEVNVGYLYGTLRIAFDSRDPSGLGHWVHARIYKNGVALGTERSQNGDWYTYIEELEFAKNDLVQIYIKNSDVGFPTEVRNLHILGKYPVPTLPASIAVP